MMTMMTVAIFSGAMALASLAIWLTIAPQWNRIVRLALGEVEQPFQPLQALASAERRIAVRRWAATPIPAPARRSHASV